MRVSRGSEGDAETEGREVEVVEVVFGLALEGDIGVGEDYVGGEAFAVGEGYAEAERAVEVGLRG